MAKFNDVKNGIPFIGEEVTPVIIISVNAKEVVGKNEKQSNKIKKSILKKIEKAITSVEGLKIKSDDVHLANEYEVTNFDETDEERNKFDEIKQSVPMVTINDISALSDLKDSLLKQLVGNVRLLDDEGKLIKIDHTLLEQNIPDDLDIYTAIEFCESVYGKLEEILEEYEKKLENQEETELIEYDESIDNEKPETMELDAFKDENYLEDNNIPPREDLVAIENIENQGTSEKEDIHDVYEVTKAQKEISSDNEQSEDVNEDSSVEEKAVEIAYTTIKNKIPEFVVQNTHKELKETLSSVTDDQKVLEPILKTSEAELNKRIKEKNATLKIEYQNVFNRIFELVKEKIIQENKRINRETSLNNEASDFFKAVIRLNKYKEDEAKKIDERSLIFENQKKSDYQTKMKEFIEAKISLIEKEYEEKNLSNVEKEIENYRKKKEIELEEAYQREYISIEAQANKARIEQKSLLADKSIQNLDIEIEQLIDEYQKSCNQLVRAAENRITREYKKLEAMLTELSIEQLKSEQFVNEKVDKKLEERSKKYISMKEKIAALNEQAKDLEAQTKMKDEMVEGYKEIAQMMKESTIMNRERLQMMSEDQAKMIEADEKLPIPFGNPVTGGKKRYGFELDSNYMHSSSLCFVAECYYAIHK